MASDAPNRRNLSSSVVFVVTILLVIGAYSLLSASSGNQTTQSSNFNGDGSSVINSSGSDICCHFVGQDPTPVGCGTPLGLPSFNQGYSLQIYVSSPILDASGDALCITPVLLNLNGTVLTQGTRDGRVSISFNVTDPSGSVVFRNDCPNYTSPPSFMSSYNQTENQFSCTAVWYTNGAAPGTGSSSTTSSPIRSGTYHISATATFPGLGGLDSNANESANAGLTVAVKTAA